MIGFLRNLVSRKAAGRVFVIGPDGAGEKAILDEALAIMSRRVGGEPMSFCGQLRSGETAIRIVFHAPNDRSPEGVIDAAASYGPVAGTTGEGFSDLSNGNFDEGTLEAVIGDVRDHFQRLRDLSKKVIQ